MMYAMLQSGADNQWEHSWCVCVYHAETVLPSSVRVTAEPDRQTDTQRETERK